MPGPFGHLAGYENVNGVERLRHDPAMRWIISGKALQDRAAPKPDAPLVFIK
jgi:hypothetical protein